MSRSVSTPIPQTKWFKYHKHGSPLPEGWKFSEQLFLGNYALYAALIETEVLPIEERHESNHAR